MIRLVLPAPGEAITLIVSHRLARTLAVVGGNLIVASQQTFDDFDRVRAQVSTSILSINSSLPSSP